MDDHALTCEKCGTFQDEESFRLSGSYHGMRQGRSSAGAASLPPRTPGYLIGESGDYQPIYDDRPDQTRQGASMGRKPVPVQVKRPSHHESLDIPGNVNMPLSRRETKRIEARKAPSKTNWTLLGLIVILLAICAGVGYFMYMNKSDEGHRITARKLVLECTPELLELAVTRDPLQMEAQEDLLREWNSVPSTAYWYVGEEYLDNGDTGTSITAFSMANILDPKNYDGLLLQASAYEMMGSSKEAEELYLYLINDVANFRSEAYTALIRIYQAQERRPEAAEMMRLAYVNTKRENFRLQREDYIPEMPEVNLQAGRYEISSMKEDILITSPQGYDVYYTTDEEAVLPQDGLLAEDGKIVPVEGSIKIRAVCVSGDLISDPLAVSYTFFYPTPPAPKCNLAPNTYKSLRVVELRAGTVEEFTKKQQAEMEANLTYYYTIDGSTPTEESPVYDGTPIQLPSGRVTLKAICVNQYGKMSSTLEVGYKFDVRPDPQPMYGMVKGSVNFSNDLFGGFELNKTTQEQFEATFGKARSVTETTYLHLTNPARHLEYDWGHAVFLLNNNQWQMVRMEMRSGFTSTPRNIGLGTFASDVMAAYKDFGQVTSPNGTRGLYYDYPRVGQYLIHTDGTHYIQYTGHTLESKMWVLQYWLQNDTVKRIVHFWQP